MLLKIRRSSENGKKKRLDCSCSIVSSRVPVILLAAAYAAKRLCLHHAAENRAVFGRTSHLWESGAYAALKVIWGL